MEVQTRPSATPGPPHPVFEQPVITRWEPDVERGWMENWWPATSAVQVRPRRFGAINVLGAIVVLGFLFFTQILFLLVLIS